MLVPVNAPQKLAEAITHMLDSPTEATLLQQRAQDYRIDKIAARYLQAAGLHS